MKVLGGGSVWVDGIFCRQMQCGGSLLLEMSYNSFTGRLFVFVGMCVAGVGVRFGVGYCGLGGDAPGVWLDVLA